MTITRDQVRFVFAAVIMLAVLLPASASALSRDEARHLLVRSGFAAEPETIDALLPLSRIAAIDRILGATVLEAATPGARLDSGLDAAAHEGSDA